MNEKNCIQAQKCVYIIYNKIRQWRVYKFLFVQDRFYRPDEGKSFQIFF
jgi:hypothetical protein